MFQARSSVDWGHVVSTFSVCYRTRSGVLRLDLTICVAGSGCDVETRPLAGTLILEFDDWWPPEQVALRDFRFRAVTNFDFSFFGGGLVGTVTNLQINHAMPGPQLPFEPLMDGQVVFRDVPSRLGGTVHYDANATICGFLIAGGQGCPGDIDLARRTPNPLGEFPMRLEVAGSTLTATATFRFGNIPLFESNPGLGTISGMGTIHASAPFLPHLRIERLEFLHFVKWPGAFTDFRLYRTDSLTPPIDWREVDPFHIQTTGTTRVANMDIEPGQSFYRLSNEPPAGAR
jgi:hypothetical protein